MDGYRQGTTVLTHEEKTAISLLEPLIERHLDVILETFALQLGSDPHVAWVLEDDRALDRLKLSQQRYLLALVREEDMMHDDNGASYRDPFGLGAQWHFRTLTHFVTALQPLAQDILGEPPLQYQTAWHALLKVVFHNLDRLMSACLTPRDQWVGAVKEEEYDATCGRDALRNSYEPESDQRLMNELKRFEASALWRANVAHEMGGPLNAILNHAEALLGNREAVAVQTALQGIVTHVEQMIRLRQALSVADEERWRY
jgi:signal transduction histidine kinase